MKYLFLHYPACGTCRKAARWLAAHGVEAESRDIVLSNPGRDELSQWIATSGLPARKFFNTSGQRYKELNLKEKVAKASDGELIALLATEGKLVKRPLLVGPDFVLVGFREEQWRKNCSAAKRQQSTAAPKAVRPSQPKPSDPIRLAE